MRSEDEAMATRESEMTRPYGRFGPPADLFKKDQIIGEMAGTLRGILFVGSDEINKEAIRDLLRRYDEEFNKDLK